MGSPARMHAEAGFCGASSRSRTAEAGQCRESSSPPPPSRGATTLPGQHAYPEQAEDVPSLRDSFPIGLTHSRGSPAYGVHTPRATECRPLPGLRRQRGMPSFLIPRQSQGCPHGAVHSQPILQIIPKAVCIEREHPQNPLENRHPTTPFYKKTVRLDPWKSRFPIRIWLNSGFMRRLNSPKKLVSIFS